MRTLNFTKLAGALAGVTIMLLANGCTKIYKADEYNPYRDDVANPPVTTGSPAIGNIFPAQGIVNTAITISGANFNPNLANNSVTINGVPAPILSIKAITNFNTISDNIPRYDITVVVPENATSGKITLKTGGKELTTLYDFKVKAATVSTYANLGENYVEHIVFDGDGNLFGDNISKIIKISAFGDISTFAGATPGVFSFIWGIASNNFDELYVPDGGRSGIYRITKAGIVNRVIGNGKDEVKDGTPDLAGVGAPRGLARDVAGNLYFTDLHRVRKISTSGVVTTIAGSDREGNVDGKGALAQFGTLDGIALDTGGRVYVTDRRYLNVRKIDRDGTVTTLAGTSVAGFADGPGNAATFSDPRGIAVDLQGNVFVSDQNKASSIYAIRVVNRAGIVRTLIKGTSNTGVINGPAATASVNSPNGLTFDKDGNLYIVNTGANIISKVTIQ